MRSLQTASTLTIALLAVLAEAQTPSYVLLHRMPKTLIRNILRYQGALLIEPGLNSGVLQAWKLISEVTRLNLGKCITATSNVDGAPVTLQTCTGADSQKWTFDSGSVKVFGSKCLDVVNGQNADGTKLQIWTCSSNQNPNQQFFYTGDYRLTWTNHGKCTDLPNGSLNDGNRVSADTIP